MRSRLTAVVTVLLLTGAALSTLGVTTAAPASAAASIFPVPTSSAGLGRIVTAPNGNMWFIERDANKVGRIAPGGQISEIPFPARFPGTTTIKDLDVAPDSTVWVLYESGQMVAHLDPNGGIIATGSIGDYGQSIRIAPDGSAWIVVSFADDYVVRIANNVISDFANSPECADSLGRANDGSMWCRTDSGLTHLGASSGGTTYPANNFAAYPYAIAAGPVGSIWFGRYFSGTFATSPDDGEVGYLDQASGAIQAFNTGERTAPADLVRGPDNAMWFTSIGAAKGIGHVNTAGQGALTAVGGYAPTSLTFGPDGAVWFTDATNNVIVRVPTSDLQVTNVDPGAGSVFTVGQAAGGSPVTVRKSKKPLVVTKGKVPLTLVCPASATAGCSGKVTLTTKKKVRKPGKKKGPKTYVALAKAGSFSIAPGAKKTVRVKLSSTGTRLLPRGRATTVRVQVGGVTIGKVALRR